MRSLWALTLGCSVAAAAALNAAWASHARLDSSTQPPRRVHGDDAPPERRASDVDSALRARLERRLHETDSQIERLETRRAELGSALERLDQGDDPSEIMRELFSAGRDRWQDAREQRHRNRSDPDDPRGSTLDSIRPVFPELWSAITRAQAERIADRRIVQERLTPRLGELLSLHARDPELASVKAEEFRAAFELHLVSQRIRRQIESGEVGERARKSLHEAIARAFDARIEAQRFEIARLGQRIVELQQQVNQRVEERESYIQSALDRVLDAMPDAGGSSDN